MDAHLSEGGHVPFSEAQVQLAADRMQSFERTHLELETYFIETYFELVAHFVNKYFYGNVALELIQSCQLVD